MSTAFKRTQSILVDSHVHIHDCFDLPGFFNSAFKNFQAASNQEQCPCLLLLTEAKSENYFRLLSQAVKAKNSHLFKLRDWEIKPTQESASLCAFHSENEEIFLIAGRQIITAEGIEILALITTQEFEEGKPLEKVIQEIVDCGGIPVLPWGFGKWIGLRGRIVRQFLETQNLPLLFLGDNSGRPNFWAEPYLFKQAKRRGLQILTGSDPLPFPSEFWRAGSYGFSVEGVFNREKPAACIKQILIELTVQPQVYGSLENPFRFVRNQIAMQLFKRHRRSK
jgi:hypothetical protein